MHMLQHPTWVPSHTRVLPANPGNLPQQRCEQTTTFLFYLLSCYMPVTTPGILGSLLLQKSCHTSVTPTLNPLVYEEDRHAYISYNTTTKHISSHVGSMSTVPLPAHVHWWNATAFWTQHNLAHSSLLLHVENSASKVTVYITTPRRSPLDREVR